MERVAFSLLAATTVALLLTGCGSGSSDPGEHEQRARSRIELGKSDEIQLNPAGSCAALEQELKSIVAAQIVTWFEPATSTPPGIAEDGSADQGGSSSDGGESTGGTGDYTNNQVAGVDEADFVKTDGERLFLLARGALHRFDIPSPGELTVPGTVAIEGQPQAMLVDGERTLVFSYIQSTPNVGAADASFMLPYLTKATLLDWSDGTGTVIAEHYYDGWYLTGRKIDGTARIILHGALPNPVMEQLWRHGYDSGNSEDALDAALADLDALPLEALLPRSYERRADGSLEAIEYTNDDCSAFEVPTDSNSGGVTSILAFDLQEGSASPVAHIVSNYPTVYASADRLFLAERAQDYWWHAWEGNSSERLNLHAFDISTPATRYIASARAEGMPVNQFALDEHEDVLRLATSVGRNGWWTDSEPETRVYTFQIGTESLQQLGQIDGIAPGETLFAARFAGDIAYLVTFEQIDPLFTVDLADPANPSIIGELKIPGFSTYLHPVNEERLLAVGVGGDANGATWNTVVSLFDVSDLASPALLATHDFNHDNHNWNWSEAMHEHKAFQFHSGAGLLAVPLHASRNTNGSYEWVSELELVRLENDTLLDHGSIDHAPYFGSNTGYGSGIRRSFFIGDYIYAISDGAVSVHPTDNPAVVLADALVPAE